MTNTFSSSVLGAVRSLSTPVKRLLRLAVPCVAALSLACSDPAAEPVGPRLDLISGPTLIECPSNTTDRDEITIDGTGGALAVSGSVFSLPIGAVLEPTVFLVGVPESPYMEVRIRAAGREHFEFLQPAVVTIDYSRCGASADGPLTVWHIVPTSKRLLENMGGIDNKLTRTITFITTHLSSYAVAN